MWMCQTHGTIIDRDAQRYPEPLLREWKALAESRAETEIGKLPVATTTPPPATAIEASRPRIRLSRTNRKVEVPRDTKALMQGLYLPLFDVRNTGAEEAFDIQVSVHVSNGVLVSARRIDHLPAGAEVTIHHADLRYTRDAEALQGMNLWMYLSILTMAKQEIQMPLPAQITYRDRKGHVYETDYDVGGDGCTFRKDQ